MSRAELGQKLLDSVRQMKSGKAGKPHARMMPLESPGQGKRKPGRLGGKIDEAFFDPLPEAELDAWEKS